MATSGQRPRERVYRRPPRVTTERFEVGPDRTKGRFRPPSWSLAIAFGLIIAIGSGLLMLPAATAGPGGAPVLTAVFTATSATFVTGLILVDTGTYWSGFGEAVIFGLIQIGGLGYMTGVAFIVLVARRRLSLGQRQVLRITFGGGVLGRLDIEARTIIVLSLLIQAIGFVFLLARFLVVVDGAGPAIWQALFHAASGFHNAGFDVTGGAPSLFEYREDPWIIVPITALSLVGALGFGVIGALAFIRRKREMILDAKLVLAGTAVIAAVGVAGILISEWDNPDTLGGTPIWNRVMDAFALSFGGRTSGFSSFAMSNLAQYTLFLMIALMFIGGASGSMTGGIKVNVFTVLLFTAWSSVRGRPQTEAFRREISDSHVRRAVTITIFSFAWINGVALTLSLFEDADFLGLLFEVVSAFALVGLSTGITAELTTLSQVILILSMFVGRLAPFLIALELVQRERRSSYRFAREEVRIG